MLISGGKVIAIDKVKHDTTLTGDGRFNPLGVNPNNLINAGDWISITGEYKNNIFTATKEAGTIEFSNGAVLKKNSVYKVTTDISFKTKSATPNWYEVNFKVGDLVCISQISSDLLSVGKIVAEVPKNDTYTYKLQFITI